MTDHSSCIITALRLSGDLVTVAKRAAMLVTRQPATHCGSRVSHLCRHACDSPIVRLDDGG